MITNIESLEQIASGCDAAARNEVSRNQNIISDCLHKRKQECEAQARQYLAEHPKPKFYVMHGYPTKFDTADNDPEPLYTHLTTYTDEEIGRIKELFLEVWNEGIDDPSKRAKTFEDIPQEKLTSIEIEDANEELDALVWNHAREEDFVARWVDWLYPVHAYRFQSCEYDRCKDMVLNKACHWVILSDEEYLYLLTEQLNDRHFLFEHLLRYNAPLALKIFDATADDTMTNSFNPHIIIMDEVLEDAEQIAGYVPVSGELCSFNENGHSYHAYLIIERDQIEVYWQDLPNADCDMEHLTEGRARNIDARAVLKLFKATDYKDLLERIQKHFNTHSAYDDLLAYLYENGIYEQLDDK